MRKDPSDMSNDDIELPDYLVDKEHSNVPKIERVMWLGEGDFCECYLVNDAYVFRFAKHDDASAAVRREICFLPIIQPYLTVTVPQVAFAGCELRNWYEMMGYRLIPGEVLESDVLESLPPAAQATLITQMANFMRQLHAIPLDVISQCGVPTLQPLTYLGEVMERARATVRPHLTDAVWNHHEALLARASADPRFSTYRPALLHGDLSPDHFLADLDTGKLTGVIDFGDVCIGDPAWDFVYILEDYGADVLTAFLAHYDSENAAFLMEKVRTYQHLNNVAYAVSALAEGNDPDFAEAMAILTEQAR